MEVKNKNYYNGTLEEFKVFLATLADEDPAAYAKLKNVATTLIGEENDESIVEKGYLYVHNAYYKLSSLNTPFDPSDYPVLELPIYKEEDYAVDDTDDDGIVTKGYLMKHTSFESIN